VRIDLERLVAKADGNGRALKNTIVHGLEGGETSVVVTAGCTEQGHLRAKHRFETGDHQIVGYVDARDDQVDHVDTRLRLFQGRRQFHRLGTRLLHKQAINLRDREILAAYRHQGDILHRLAHAFATDHAGTGPRNDACAGTLRPRSGDQVAQRVADRGIDDQQVAIIAAFAQGDFETLHDRPLRIRHSGAGRKELKHRCPRKLAFW